MKKTSKAFIIDASSTIIPMIVLPPFLYECKTKQNRKQKTEKRKPKTQSREKSSKPKSYIVDLVVVSSAGVAANLRDVVVDADTVVAVPPSVVGHLVAGLPQVVLVRVKSAIVGQCVDIAVGKDGSLVAGGSPVVDMHLAVAAAPLLSSQLGSGGGVVDAVERGRGRETVFVDVKLVDAHGVVGGGSGSERSVGVVDRDLGSGVQRLGVVVELAPSRQRGGSVLVAAGVLRPRRGRIRDLRRNPVRHLRGKLLEDARGRQQDRARRHQVDVEADHEFAARAVAVLVHHDVAAAAAVHPLDELVVVVVALR
ncbi:hypothetical protein FN846DRAFT_1000356 [Sphaerosporella brunnea]|uniref:Uncharacterized protein n=1 Tax=Sphaerosporella brunnea TaxID=1250544 RepID=A0A5J5F4W3_9PEZI|nr:hypothetical protein FN846DRAFT_1000356 [Sphaerosporella brunnea]